MRRGWWLVQAGVSASAIGAALLGAHLALVGREAQLTPAVVSAAPLPPVPALRAPAADLAVASARPLFRADRRPAEDPVEAAVPTADPVAETAAPLLLGVLVAGGRRRALLAADDEPEGRWVALGDSFLGWRLVDVAADMVDVERGAARTTVRLRPETALQQLSRPMPRFPWSGSFVEGGRSWR